MFQTVENKHPAFYQVFRIFVILFASILYAWNLRCFAKNANLLPGGFSGVSLLLQQIGIHFFHISIPYTFFAPRSFAVRYTPARLELIAAVGPPDCPTITFPFM